MTLFLIFSFFLGACIGSFLNVLILRIPKEESLWRKSSYCYSCGQPIRFYHNIPILSYLILRGKCSKCKTKFSSQYVIIEFITALLFLVTFYYRFAPHFDAIAQSNFSNWEILSLALIPWLADVSLLSLLLAMIVIDARHLIIPYEITISGFVIGLALSLIYPELHGSHDWLGAIGNIGLAMIAGGGLFLVVRWLASLYFKREALGMGDVHLLIMLALFLNWPQIILTIFLSSLVGSIGGITTKMLSHKNNWRFEIPYGPYIAIGAIISYFWGNSLISMYLDLYLRS